MSWIKFINASCETTHRWMPHSTFNDKSTLAHVMAWCHQAPSHYISQCWSHHLCRHLVSLGHNELTWFDDILYTAKQWQMQCNDQILVTHKRHPILQLRTHRWYPILHPIGWIIGVSIACCICPDMLSQTANNLHKVALDVNNNEPIGISSVTPDSLAVNVSLLFHFLFICVQLNWPGAS